MYKPRIILGNVFQWPRGIRRGSMARRLLGLRVRILPGVSMSVFCKRSVLSRRGICDWPIACQEEPYRVLCLDVISNIQ